MPIELKTVYTKDRLLKFYKVVAASKKWFWILMTICSLLVISASVFLAIVDELTSTTIAGLIFIVAMDITYIILYFVAPHFTINKSKILNTVIDYSFDSDTVTSHAVNSYINETSTIKYSVIFKVIKKDYDLYLFTARNRAMLVDISSLSSDQIALLKNTIESQIASKKINWKD